jgi:hypothetical protein
MMVRHGNGPSGRLQGNKELTISSDSRPKIEEERTKDRNNLDRQGTPISERESSPFQRLEKAKRHSHLRLVVIGNGRQRQESLTPNKLSERGIE